MAIMGRGGGELDSKLRPVRSNFKRWAKPKNVNRSKNTKGIKGNSLEHVSWISELVTITETLI